MLGNENLRMAAYECGRFQGFEGHLQVLKAQYASKANEVAMRQWEELIAEVKMFMDDQQPNILYSFSKRNGIIAAQGFTIDFYPPAHTFANRLMKLRSQILLAMANVDCGSGLYNVLDSLYIMVLYALYDDESGRHLVRWKSEHEKNLRAWMDPADVDEMIQSVLEEILI